MSNNIDAQLIKSYAKTMIGHMINRMISRWKPQNAFRRGSYDRLCQFIRAIFVICASLVMAFGP